MNWKDTLSSICGLIILISATMATISTQVVLPSWVLTASIIAGAMATTLVSWLTGKNPNLTSKTMRQVDNLNNEQAATKGIK